MTPPEIPEGKVLVDEADLRDLARWLEPTPGFPAPRIPYEQFWCGQANAAIDRLVAALPVPEWEPSTETRRQYTSALGCGHDRPEDCDICIANLKKLHGAGLLRGGL